MSNKKEFVISDESLNRFGFVVLTSGIDIEKFIRNPVMFFNHDREAGVIGRWENVRVDNGKLFATPVFDETDEVGLKISQKVENGFIRAASIGVEPIDRDETGTVLLSCELIECSICDIPSNSNALMLYQNGNQVKNNEEYLNLNLIKTPKTMKNEDVTKILEALGLTPDATIEDTLAAIAAISGESPSKIVENAINMNVVKAYEKPSLLKMAVTDFQSFAKYMKERETNCVNERKAEAMILINAAVQDGRLGYPANSHKSKDFLLKAMLLDFEAGKVVLENLNKRTIYSQLIKGAVANVGRSDWTLADYRKKAPQELAANPGLYQRLLEEENIVKQTK
jgi:HK97 family phage prohead protease